METVSGNNVSSCIAALKDKKTDGQKERQIDRQTETDRQKQASGQTHTHTERERERERREREREERERETCTSDVFQSYSAEMSGQTANNGEDVYQWRPSHCHGNL